MQIWTRKLAAGVTFLRQSRDRLTRETAIDHLEPAVGILRVQKLLEELHVATGVRDAVAEKKDALDAGQKVISSCGGERETEQRENETHGGI